MQNIYDNGRLCLGEVGKIRQQLIDNAEETWEIEDILAELKELEDNTIVAINYDNGMGYSIEYWTTKDIITQKNERIEQHYTEKEIKNIEKRVLKCRRNF